MSLDPRQHAPAQRRPSATSGVVGRRRPPAPPAQAGVELPGRRPEALGDRQHARGDGPAARLLLPRDRAADPPQRARHRGPGRRRCPALAMYILIGRTPDYAWSLTSANHDVRDVFAEQLCDPDGSPPTRESDHYLFEGECRPFVEFDAGTLNGTPIRYPTSVHGPVIGTATVDGQPYALTRQRSTFGRDGLNLAALKDMTEGKARHARRSSSRPRTSSGSRSTGRTRPAPTTAYFSSGRLPRRRARASTGGCRRSAPATTSGAASCPSASTRTSVAGPDGLLLNWNNQSAPGFMHGDDAPFGSVHRVELFDQFPRRVTLADDVERHEPGRDRGRPLARVARREPGAAQRCRPRTRSPTAPSTCSTTGCSATRRGSTPTTTASTTTPARRSWTRCGARSPTAVMRPVYGDLLDDLDDVRSLGRARRRVVRRQGPAHAARADRGPGPSSTCATAATARSTPAGRRCGPRSTQPWPRARRRAGAGSGGVARRRVAHRLRAGPHPRHDPGHEPPDVPAGARVRTTARNG